MQVFLDPLHLLVRVGDLLLEKLIGEVLDTVMGRCTTYLKFFHKHCTSLSFLTLLTFFH